MPIGFNPWPGKGYIYQPFGLSAWFYGDDGAQARFGLRDSQLGSAWTVRVRGLPTLLGNTAFYLGHTDNAAPRGIEVFDLSPVLQAQPSGGPTLVSSVIDAESAKGYWPELWGGRDPATGRQLVRAFFNAEGEFFSIWDLSD